MRLDPSIKEDKQAVATAVADKNLQFRSLAIHALGAFGADAKTSLPVLFKVLREEHDRSTRAAAMKSLEQIGPGTRVIVAILDDALKDRDAQVRADAARTLAQIGSEAKAAVPSLIAGLKDKDANVRLAMTEGLSALGLEVLPALSEALKDDDASVRRYVTIALLRIDRDALAKDPINAEVTGRPARAAILALGTRSPDVSGSAARQGSGRQCVSCPGPRTTRP